MVVKFNILADKRLHSFCGNIASGTISKWSSKDSTFNVEIFLEIYFYIKKVKRNMLYKLISSLSQTQKGGKPQFCTHIIKSVETLGTMPLGSNLA